MTVQQIEYVTWLDVNAWIENSSGSKVISNNTKADRRSYLKGNLPAGSYKLVVESGAEGTPRHGFPRYSSLGWYGITGTVSGTIGGSAPVVKFNKPKDGDVFTMEDPDQIANNIQIELNTIVNTIAPPKIIQFKKNTYLITLTISWK